MEIEKFLPLFLSLFMHYCVCEHANKGINNACTQLKHHNEVKIKKVSLKMQKIFANQFPRQHIGFKNTHTHIHFYFFYKMMNMKKNSVIISLNRETMYV